MSFVQVLRVLPAHHHLYLRPLNLARAHIALSVCYGQLPALFPLPLTPSFVLSPDDGDVSFNALYGWLVI